MPNMGYHGFPGYPGMPQGTGFPTMPGMPVYAAHAVQQMTTPVTTTVPQMAVIGTHLAAAG